jgi:hypothetical protein
MRAKLADFVALSLHRKFPFLALTGDSFDRLSGGHSVSIHLVSTSQSSETWTLKPASTKAAFTAISRCFFASAFPSPGTTAVSEALSARRSPAAKFPFLEGDRCRRKPVARIASGVSKGSLQRTGCAAGRTGRPFRTEFLVQLGKFS